MAEAIRLDHLIERYDKPEAFGLEFRDRNIERVCKRHIYALANEMIEVN